VSEERKVRVVRLDSAGNVVPPDATPMYPAQPVHVVLWAKLVNEGPWVPPDQRDSAENAGLLVGVVLRAWNAPRGSEPKGSSSP
jgi:hypothetical protein